MIKGEQKFIVMSMCLEPDVNIGLSKNIMNLKKERNSILVAHEIPSSDKMKNKRYGNFKSCGKKRIIRIEQKVPQKAPLPKEVPHLPIKKLENKVILGIK